MTPLLVTSRFCAVFVSIAFVGSVLLGLHFVAEIFRGYDDASWCVYAVLGCYAVSVWALRFRDFDRDDDSGAIVRTVRNAFGETYHAESVREIHAILSDPKLRLEMGWRDGELARYLASRYNENPFLLMERVQTVRVCLGEHVSVATLENEIFREMQREWLLRNRPVARRRKDMA